MSKRVEYIALVSHNRMPRFYATSNGRIFGKEIVPTSGMRFVVTVRNRKPYQDDKRKAEKLLARTGLTLGAEEGGQGQSDVFDIVPIKLDQAASRPIYPESEVHLDAGLDPMDHNVD